MYKIEIHKEALKFLRSLPDDISKKITKKLESLVFDPYPLGSIKLKGYQDDLFRIRIGKYRTLYNVSSPDLTIYVIKIDKRGTVYD